jgi:transposase-like protein
MNWQFTPVERLQDFRPPFCPRRECPEHRRSSPGFRFRLHASYRVQGGRTVQRYRCMTCGKTFSKNAFSVKYWLKRPELLLPVAAGLQGGSAHRQIARTLGCAPSTVTRLAARIGRHCMLLLERALQSIDPPLTEAIVLDHFETFEFTQDFPFGVATAVGSASWFVYAIDPAPHRRTGRRSPAQQKRLDRRPARQHHGGYEASSLRMIRRLLSLNGDAGTLKLIADDHPAYRAAVARLDVARDQALFPADLLHALCRHSLAAHKRQTIAFGRRLNALMERFFVFIAWRNFIKGRSERRPDPETPAMRLGLTQRPWSWRMLLARRLFPARSLELAHAAGAAAFPCPGGSEGRLARALPA